MAGEEWFYNKISRIGIIGGITGHSGIYTVGGSGHCREHGKREAGYSLNASNFKFKPDNLRIPKPGPVTLAVENISDIEHNFTIKNPKRQVLKSVDLPPKKKTTVTFDLPEPGKYEFYCDIDSHASLGMKGQIQVGD